MDLPPQVSTFINLRPVHVTLTKNTRGYSWEISVHSETVEGAIKDIGTINAIFSDSYGQEPETSKA